MVLQDERSERLRNRKLEARDRGRRDLVPDRRTRGLQEEQREQQHRASEAAHHLPPARCRGIVWGQRYLRDCCGARAPRQVRINSRLLPPKEAGRRSIAVRSGHSILND